MLGQYITSKELQVHESSHEPGVLRMPSLAHLFVSSNTLSPLSMQILCVFQAPLPLDLILDLQAEVKVKSSLRMHSYTPKINILDQLRDFSELCI